MNGTILEMILLYHLIGLVCLSPCVSGFLPVWNHSFLNRRMATTVTMESVAELYRDIENKQVQELIVNKDLNSILSVNMDDVGKQIVIHPIQAQPIISKSLDYHIPVTVVTPPSNALIAVWNFVFPFLVWGVFYYLVSTVFVNRVQQGGGGSGGLPNLFGGDRFYSKPVETPNVNLTDWAGSPEIFQECYEVVSYLKDGAKFREIGAKVPRGVLLEGPPGTGKTLLAKAIASETGAKFYSTVASEFVELFVGMGAKRIRSLFEDARKNKPSIIFIDEIDAIGKSRSSASLTGNDEREQALNQLLSEMDGFTPNDDILVIAATNRKDTLDAALLRPGRFDRIIPVPLPDVDSRLAILQVHLKDTKVSDNVTMEVLEYLADNTEGFSGADLSNVVNEGLILAVRNNRTEINAEDLFHSLEKSMVGIVKDLDSRSYQMKRRIAIHEIGHALAVLCFPSFKLDKVSVRPTYNGAGGYTMYSTVDRDEGLYSKEVLLEKIAILLGGKAAETVFYGENGLSTGAVYDLQQANILADQLVRKFGMGDGSPNYYDYKEEYSEHLLKQLEQEAQDLLDNAFFKVYEAITENQHKMDQLIPLLIQENTMTGDEFEDFFRSS